MKDCQRSVDSSEFAEWIAFWNVEGEMRGDIERDPTPDELGVKLRAWAAQHNARNAAQARK